MKVTPEVAQAFSNLRGSSDFHTILKWVEECGKKEQETCNVGDGLILYRAQGAVRVLREFQEIYAEAPESLKKFQQHHPRPKVNTP